MAAATKYQIDIDYTRDKLFDELGLVRLKESYMAAGETSPQERYAYVSSFFASSQEHAQRLYDYASKHWLSYSTPILAHHESKKGLGISCYVNYLEDSSKGLVDNLSLSNWLSMYGGGVGVNIGIRGADGKSVGVMPHMKTYDSCSMAYKQGSRRGSYAAYLDINHPDIVQFIEMRKPTGDPNMRTPNLNHGINVSDEFMEVIKRCMVDPNANDDWPLIQPHNGKVTEVVSAKELWQKILETRMQTGEPYLYFIDTVNRQLPQYQQDAGLRVNGSNLCVELCEVTSAERTAVCCLSSVNLEYWEEWKDNEQFLPDVLEMLDNVLEFFIANAPDTIATAKYSAYRERSVGIGALGFHALLQQKGIPFESALAKSINMKIFKHIKTSLDDANLKLAEVRGSCPDAADYGVKKRNTHTMAIAPNASTSIVMGNTSPSIEPFAANFYRQDTTSGTHFNKNKYLEEIILEKSKSEKVGFYEETWSSIVAHEGSVQHIEWLDDWQKDVFKTAMEIDQRWIIDLAADRQQFVDQSQSLNIFFEPDSSIQYIHAVHFMAWASGVKSLYYCRSKKLRKGTDKVGLKVERKKIEDEINMVEIAHGDGCLACE
jgi:ribonucleoside-diphosphate reductase alpha chain